MGPGSRVADLFGAILADGRHGEYRDDITARELIVAIHMFGALLYTTPEGTDAQPPRPAGIGAARAAIAGTVTQTTWRRSALIHSSGAIRWDDNPAPQATTGFT